MKLYVVSYHVNDVPFMYRMVVMQPSYADAITFVSELNNAFLVVNCIEVEEGYLPL